MVQQAHRVWLVLVSLCLMLALGACSADAGPNADDVGADSIDSALVSVEHARFPTREAVDSAFHNFQRDPASARAGQPIPLNEFFGEQVNGAFSAHYKIELLKSDARLSREPIAALHANFQVGSWGPGDINNRYKDVHLFKLADALGVAMNPFPAAAKIPGEQATLLRIWTDFRKMAKGVPEDMAPETVAGDLARINVWSYVVGNTDGVNNSGNCGFAKFRDASGRESWRAVLLDAGGSFTPNAQWLQKPWSTKLAGREPPMREVIPDDVIRSMQQLARASDADLLKWMGLDPTAPTDQGLATQVSSFRARAQEVLTGYGHTWN